MKPATTVMAAALLSVLGGCSAATNSASSGAAGGMSAAEIEAVYRARLEEERSKFTPADAAFMAGMIHHHAQAVEMSRLAPAHGASAQIQTLAARILNAQQAEIATMQQWLRQRAQPVPEVHYADEGVMVHVPGHDGHHVHMPGMLSPEQMQRLKQARGAEFDRLFLEYMIMHHRGAVTMVRELFATDGAAQDDSVFKFASDVQADQGSEVARMERMLAALQGGRAP